MRAAGVRRIGGAIETLELPEPRAPRPDEVLIEVRAAGVGNWDEYVRDGSWDVGIRPPMALGVEAAGVVTAAGESVREITVGALVATYSAPLREQGSWAAAFIAPAGDVALVPPARRALRRAGHRDRQRPPEGGTCQAGWRGSGRELP